MLDKNKFERFSCLSSKWVVKQQRQLATSTGHLPQELLMNGQCIGGSRGFTKMRALEMSSLVEPLKVDNDQLRASLKLILLQPRERFLKNSVSTILWWLSIWRKLERWDSLISGCLVSWLKIFKKLSFWSIIFSYSMLQQQTISRSDCDMRLNVDFMTTGNDQLSGWTEKTLQSTSQSQTCTKKGVVTHGLLPIWSTTAFWIPAIPLHLRTMLRKSMRCTKNGNASSQDWSTERAQFFPTTTLDHMSHDQCFKSWTNWAAKFCLICHIHLTSCQLTTTFFSFDDHFFKHFLPQLLAEKTFPQPGECRKCFLRVRRILKYEFLCYRNKQTYFSLAKKCIDCNVSSFD